MDSPKLTLKPMGTPYAEVHELLRRARYRMYWALGAGFVAGWITSILVAVYVIK